MLEPIGHESVLHLILASIVELGVGVFDCGDHVEFAHPRICTCRSRSRSPNSEVQMRTVAEAMSGLGDLCKVKMPSFST